MESAEFHLLLAAVFANISMAAAFCTPSDRPKYRETWADYVGMGALVSLFAGVNAGAVFVLADHLRWVS